MIVRILFDRIVELVEDLKDFQKYKLVFSLLQSCKKLSEQGMTRHFTQLLENDSFISILYLLIISIAFTPLFQAFKITDPAVWAPIHEIKFPLPPGATPVVSNAFIVPVASEVLKKTITVGKLNNVAGVCCVDISD